MPRLALLLVTSLAASGLPAQSPVVTDQVSGTTSLLQAVSAVNDWVVWASGHGGAVVRTTDGGAHWQLRPVAGADKLEFRDVHALSAKVAWLLSAGPGPASRIYRTTDGGATWSLQFTNADTAAFFDCITFFDKRTGVAFSDAAGGRTLVLRTDDAGAHWNLLPPSAVPAPLTGEGAFAASGGCVVSFGKHSGWIATGSPAGRILRSSDAGRTWQAFATPFVHGDGAGMTATSWRSEVRGIGVASRISARGATDTASAVVGVTEDGGATWQLGNRPAQPGGIYGVTWVPRGGQHTAVASALSGLLVTTDAGTTWTQAAPKPYWSVAAAGRRAWGVGPGGRITRLDF